MLLASQTRRRKVAARSAFEVVGNAETVTILDGKWGNVGAVFAKPAISSFRRSSEQQTVKTGGTT
jgi:hypothetical protein